MTEEETGQVGHQVGYYKELTQEEKIKRYRARIEWAKNEQQDFFNKAAIYLTYYRNTPRVFTKGGQAVVVPTVIKNVDAMFAALTAFEVVPVVAPKGLTSYDMARVQQEALRNEWEEQEVVEKSEYAIKESLVTGIGYVKVGYEYEAEGDEAEATGETFNPETGEVEVTTESDDSNVVVIKDRVVVDHIPFDEIYFDPEAKKWDDLTWIAQRYELPLEDVKADPTFTNTEDLKPSTVITDRWTGKGKKWSSGESSPDEERVVLWEVWDLVRGITCIIPEGTDEIIKEFANPYAARLDLKKRNPFVPYITRTDIGIVQGISDVRVMKPMADEQNIIRSSVATYVERFKPKMMSEEGAMTEAGKKAFKSQEWGEVVELTQGRIMQNSVKPMDMPILPQEAFLQDDRSGADASDAIGMNELLGGQLPVGRKTATAMQQLGQATTVRQSEKRNRLERFYKQIADRMLFLMQSLYQQDRITRLVTEMGDVVWDWKADDIAFESSIAVEVEPKEVLDTDAKREKFLAMLNILGADPAIDQVALKTYVLRDGLGIPIEIVRTLVKTPEMIQAESETAFQQKLAEKAVGPGTPVPESFDLGVNPSMEPGALGGPPPDLGESAETGGVASASPVV